RWDPNEDPGPRSWRVDEIRLTRPHEATGGLFEVAWTDAAHTDGATVDIGIARTRSGIGSGTLVAGIAQQAGANRATIALTSTPPGQWWGWIRATTPGGVQSMTTASGVLVATGRISGADRVATGVALSRNGWPDRADTVVVASARGFPDALAGV